MRIVHCVFGMQTGGAEILTVALVNNMCYTNEVFVIIVNNDWNSKIINQIDKRVKLYFIGRTQGSRNPIPIINLNLLLYRLKPDIIHCHNSKMAKIIKVQYAKTLCTIHDIGLPIDSYHRFDLLIAISDAVYKDVTSKSPTLVKTIYNGISVDSFTRRSNYCINKDEPIKLIQVSRLVHEKKGQDILLHALASIKKNTKIRFMLDIVGSGCSLNYLKKLTNQLGLESNVNFRGEKTSEWLYFNLSEYHLLVQPSRYEGFGLTILEGFAAGLPVLASNIDGPSEIINKISRGFLFENGNVQKCADQIITIYTLYKEGKIKSYILGADEIAKIDYSIAVCANKYLSVYKNLKFKEVATV